jgi:hypothetical protein
LTTIFNFTVWYWQPLDHGWHHNEGYYARCIAGGCQYPVGSEIENGGQYKAVSTKM